VTPWHNQGVSERIAREVRNGNKHFDRAADGVALAPNSRKDFLWHLFRQR
jgi:hypothetical protein